MAYCFRKIWIPVFTAKPDKGQPKAESKSIEDLIPFARRCCGKWIKSWPNEVDDIISVALLALVKAYRAWPGEGNLKGYIRVSIDNEIKNYLTHNKIIRIPRTEIRKQLKADEPFIVKVHLCSQVADDNFTIELLAKAKEVSPLGYEEICKLLKLSDQEQVILDLRFKGHTLTEIGKRIGKAHHTVLYHIKQIKKRYQQLRKQHPELPKGE